MKRQKDGEVTKGATHNVEIDTLNREISINYSNNSGKKIATTHYMAEKIRHFKDLVVWQKAHELALKIYKMTEKMPKIEIFGMTSQLRRAATSVTANIAEGMGRNSYGDRTRFYYNARGSIYEIESFLITAKDLGYISEDSYKELIELLEFTRKILNNFIRKTEEMKR